MENSKIQFPTLPKDEYFYISPEGLSRIGNIYDKNEPLKHVIWTNDYTVELPIPMKKEGPGSERPITLIEALESSVSKFPKNKAMAVKKDNKWKTWTYEELYSDVRNFASALISLGINNYKALNIIGFNDPAWFISFFGCIFANVLPVGVYTTNGPEACKYVAEHSEAEIVVVENKAHLKKYLQVWDELPRLKYIVVYKDSVPADLPEKRRSQVMTFDDMLKIGVQFAKESKNEVLQARKEKQKPGNCCTLVYTSGTTGLPKAVMLSHDNYTWLGSIFYKQYDHLMPAPKPDGTFEEELRVVSYLPLSHVAAQFTEMIVPLSVGASVYFALPTALQGSLIETLKEVRPVFLLSVPRLWEKIEETLKNMAKSNGFVKKSLADWAKGMGVEGTLAEQEGKPTPMGWGVAKTIVYNNVKKALGIDNCRLLLYGAAPLSHNTRSYFSSLNIFLINIYGMSENAGPETYYAPFKGVPANLKSAGLGLPGTTIAIYNPDKDGDGEICFRGRNRFMGYYKDDENTKQVIDEKGFLHSGDVGHVNKNGHLFITGRLKELIITAGGENIAPVLIENEIKAAIPEISQCVVIGENRKYLSVLITLKHEVQGEGLPGENLDKFVLAELKNQGCAATKVKDLRTDPSFVKYIEAGLAKANNKAISRAHNVRKWYLLESDFSTVSGEMTPTMKLKRKVVSTKFAKEIETMYEEPKL